MASSLLERGNPLWQARLEQLQHQFHDWTAKVRSTTFVPDEEEALLRRMEKTWDEINARQQEAIELHEKGHLQQAKDLLLTEINEPLSKEAYGLCEQFVTLNDRYVKEIMAHADRRIQNTAWMVGVSVLLTLGLSGVLLWLLLYRVLSPLRGMMADARLFQGDRCDCGDHPEDELQTVGIYLRELMSDVTSTRPVWNIAIRVCWRRRSWPPWEGLLRQSPMRSAIR